jgi:hypothetical protein
MLHGIEGCLGSKDAEKILHLTGRIIPESLG